MTPRIDSLLTRVAGSTAGFVREDEGATMVEYGLMVSLIALAAFASVVYFGTQLQALYENISNEITAAL
ncbi:MAG: Flp family type IVb pilin [Trinickia sp.]|uniref:Flp family type IVb pilin n=1 Tax=Trinickia sp. TaxID=2571163 RepID=UPI003F822F90